MSSAEHLRIYMIYIMYKHNLNFRSILFFKIFQCNVGVLWQVINKALKYQKTAVWGKDI